MKNKIFCTKLQPAFQNLKILISVTFKSKTSLCLALSKPNDCWETLKQKSLLIGILSHDTLKMPIHNLMIDQMNILKIPFEFCQWK